MKTTTLITALLIQLSAFGQLNTAATGYILNNTDTTSQCNLRSAPNAGGLGYIGSTITAT